MPAVKRQKHAPRYSVQPQSYEHRVEIAIEALFHATLGIHTLVRFMQQQQTPDWKEMQLISVAAEDFKKSIRWLNNRIPDGTAKKRRGHRRRP